MEETVQRLGGLVVVLVLVECWGEGRFVDSF